MGVLFSASPYADWSSGFLFAVYLLNVVSTLGKTLDAASPDRGQRLYLRDSAEYERCVEAGALRVEAGEMTACLRAGLLQATMLRSVIIGVEVDLI